MNKAGKGIQDLKEVVRDLKISNQDKIITLSLTAVVSMYPSPPGFYCLIGTASHEKGLFYD